MGTPGGIAMKGNKDSGNSGYPLQLVYKYNYIIYVMWCIRLSFSIGSVAWEERGNYSEFMSAVENCLCSGKNSLESALKDANEAVGMIDDLIEFAWNQKCRIQLPKLVEELNSSKQDLEDLLTVTQDFVDEQREMVAKGGICTNPGTSPWKTWLTCHSMPSPRSSLRKMSGWTPV